jgi:hypothetical protein
VAEINKEDELASPAQTGEQDQQRPEAPAAATPRRFEGPPGDTGAIPMASPTIISLIGQYQATLASFPERKHALPFRLRRLSVATDYFLVEHIRTVLDVLERRHRARAAVQPGTPDNSSDDLRRIEDFSASLPPQPSRWYRVGLGALILIVAEALLRFLARGIAGTQQGSMLADELEKLTNPDVNAPARAIQAVLHTNIYGVCFVGICISLGAYIVLRPLATGMVASRAIRHAITPRRWWPIPRRQTRRADSSDVARREQKVFDQLHLPAPRESPLDPFVCALPCVAALLLALGVLSLYAHGLGPDGGPTTSISVSQVPTVSPSAAFVGPSRMAITYAKPAGELIFALLIGAIAALRLGHLANTYRSRRPTSTRRLSAHAAASGTPHARPSGIRALVRPALLAAAVTAGFVLYNGGIHRPPSVDATLTSQSLPPNRLRMTVACDESCELNSVSLGLDPGDGSLSNPAPGVEPDLFLTLPGSDFTLHRTHTFVFPLTQSQARWLTHQIRTDDAISDYRPPDSSAAIGLTMTGQDGTPNSVTVDIG